MVRAKKQFGQHFLKSTRALAKIVTASNPKPEDIILEIGPGTGILTEKLISFAGKVIAIEKDRELIPLLQEKFKKEIETKKLELIEKDVLDFDPELLTFYKEHPYKLVANIPYYITGAILEKFLSAKTQPELMVLLVQKEVAERIVGANPRTRQGRVRAQKESILSISVKAYGTPKLIAKVPRGAFAPPPNVDSAILSIENISRDFFNGLDEKQFFEIMKTAFGQKRKTVGKTLGEVYGTKVVAALIASHIDPKTRPEDIPLSSWKLLCHALVA